MAWKRLVARFIDEILFAYAFFFALDAFGVRTHGNPGIEFIVQFILFPVLFIPAEAIQLALFRRTLGKYLLRLQVDCAGGAIPFRLALKRSLLVWWRGIAAGIPVLSIVAMGVAYGRFSERGITSWDEELGTQVRAT